MKAMQGEAPFGQYERTHGAQIKSKHQNSNCILISLKSHVLRKGPEKYLQLLRTASSMSQPITSRDGTIPHLLEERNGSDL